MGGEVKESTYKGFMESFDPTTHHMNAGVVRQRLEAGGVRDDAGRFRIRPGSSLLHPKESTGERGISLAQLQAEAEAERKAKEAAKHKKRKLAADPKADAAAPPVAAAAAATAAGAAAARGAGAAPSTWLCLGIVVKLLAKDTPTLHKAKGVVRRVLVDTRSAEVELLEGGARHVLREEQLETVLPKPGGKARGALRPCTAPSAKRPEPARAHTGACGQRPLHGRARRAGGHRRGRVQGGRAAAGRAARGASGACV
jgi:hypothetical protein